MPEELDALQEQYDTLVEQKAALDQQMQVLGAEMNQRRGAETAQRIFASIDPESMPAIVKLATLQMGATVGEVAAQ